MTLKPTDMLLIQSAIDDYERKFPRRPAPSAEVALVWRLGKRQAARVLGYSSPELECDGQDDGVLTRAWQQMKLRCGGWTLTNQQPSESFETMTPWVRGVLVVGGWSVGAVVAISLFFFGALVGGFK